MSERNDTTAIDSNQDAVRLSIGGGAAGGSAQNKARQTASLEGRWQELRNRFSALNGRQKLILGAATAAVVAALIAFSFTSDGRGGYKVLYSNLNDRDGGAIVNALQQMNVPYKFTEGGTAIMVPDPFVHETRLKLAGQGLPKSGYVGFEVLENQKLGTSQFVEQLNYQRALEGELSRSIATMAQVKTARVHLAIPKQTSFVRDKEKPTASVMVTMYPGRYLDQEQVVAITHLVGSSVPNLGPQNVTVIDQDGNMLAPRDKREDTMDVAQQKYISELEAAYAKRIMALVEPVAGPDNVRAQVTLNIAFDEKSLVREVYGKNSAPNEASIRSQQSVESSGQQNASGAVPGALTNQAPVQPIAPLAGPLADNNEARQLQPPSNQGGENSSFKKENTINYEVDREIENIKFGKSHLNRLSAAVVLNYKTAPGSDKKSTVPYTDKELEDIRETVRRGIGFDEARGDSFSLTNIPFNDAEADMPLYQQPGFMEMIQMVLKFLLLFTVIVLAYVAFNRLLFAKRQAKTEIVEPEFIRPPEPPKPVVPEKSAAELAAEAKALKEAEDAELRKEYEELVAYATDFARREPQISANLLKNWMQGKNLDPDWDGLDAKPARGGA